MSASDDFRLWREQTASLLQMKRIETVDQHVDPNDVYEDDTRVARMEQFGDIVCPPAGEMGVLLTAGHGGVGMVLSSPRYKPKTEAADGRCYVDRGLYCTVPGTCVLLHGEASTTPGKLEIASGTHAGARADVVVNGGTLKVARDTDPLKPNADMMTFIRNVATVVNGIAAGTVPAGLIVNLEFAFGNINGGAANFKG